MGICSIITITTEKYGPILISYVLPRNIVVTKTKAYLVFFFVYLIADVKIYNETLFNSSNKLCEEIAASHIIKMHNLTIYHIKRVPTIYFI